mmetsp:Transcript_12630/g.14054  ORF Transcript_12630/g.14054 Transcript_12630/m.14054 type:complete len:472 (-) Transcript_12630:290-1705(-)
MTSRKARKGSQESKVSLEVTITIDTEEHSKLMLHCDPNATAGEVLDTVCKKHKIRAEQWAVRHNLTDQLGTAVKQLPTSQVKIILSRKSQQKKTYIIECFSDIPQMFQQKIIQSSITPKQAQKNLSVVMNLLHFKTKNMFYTPEQYANRHRNHKRIKRRNKGHSRVSTDIVSVEPLDKEEAVLLQSDYRKKDYKCVCLVGKGGFGKVFVYKSHKDGHQVAVKKVPHNANKLKRKNFQEIRFLKYCKHPNIVKYYRSFKVKEEIWIITEFMQGGTLAQAVKVHEFSESELCYVAREVSRAIDFLHRNKLAHRDLKSQNIMLSLSGEVKIIDFGLCSDISQGEVVHMVGSPFWMAPEMIRREPHGLKADIWSFGICMMELANGAPPCKSSSVLAMFTAATKGFPDPLKDSAARNNWSFELRDYLSHCLETTPKNRWSIEQLLKHPWMNECATRSTMKGVFKTIFLTTKLAFNV